MDEAESYINDIPRFAKKTELKNTELLLGELGISPEDMKIIHVAGTNGKGSVCAYISNTLVKAGHRTGLFVSPHLVHINERIQIDNTPVSDELFIGAFQEVKEAAHRLERSGGRHPAYFEFLFGMAMLVFKRQKAKYVVLETGLGGRLDSTNVVKKPLVTVITSISRDHMHILGNTLEEIASEKAGIIKEGVPLILSGGSESVNKVILERADALGAPAETVGAENVGGVQKRGKFIDFSLNSRYYDNEPLTVQSAAYYQVYNSAVAAVALDCLMRVCPECGLNHERIREGIRTARWEGRMEEILPGVYVDGAHNEDGIRAFLETASAIKDGPQILMFSAVADKDYETMLREICDSGAFEQYVVCAVGYENRAVPGRIFYEMLRRFTDKPVYLEDTVKDALSKALSLKQENDRLFIAGSLYLVGEVKAVYGGNHD